MRRTQIIQAPRDFRIKLQFEHTKKQQATVQTPMYNENKKHELP